jgi:hypothetical protein
MSHPPATQRSSHRPPVKAQGITQHEATEGWDEEKILAVRRLYVRIGIEPRILFACAMGPHREAASARQNPRPAMAATAPKRAALQDAPLAVSTWIALYYHWYRFAVILFHR